MGKLELAFDIFARDRASKNLDKVGNAAQRTGKKFSGLQKAAGAALAGGALVKFASSSVKAYAEAEAAQTKLTDAFTRFPKLADSNIGSFRKLNEALATKTRFDDDATATGQAVLAQFNLTGKQIEKLTPLMQDYAAKTGQDLPSAAKNLGLALLGNARALKQIGISLPKATDKQKALSKAQGDAVKAEDALYLKRRKVKDLQTVMHGKDKTTVADRVRLRNALDDVRRAEDKHKDALLRVKDAQKGAAKTGETYDRVVKGLTEKVGGFAAKEGTTAAGKLEIMRNKFGEVQEQIGLKLMPMLIRLADYMNTTLIPAFSKLVDFIGANSGLFKAVAGIAAAFYLIIKVQKAVLAFQTIFRGKMVAEAVLTSRAVAAASVAGGVGGVTPIVGGGKGKAGGKLGKFGRLGGVAGGVGLGFFASQPNMVDVPDPKKVKAGFAAEANKNLIPGVSKALASALDTKVLPQSKAQTKATLDTKAELAHMRRLSAAQNAHSATIDRNIAALLGVVKNLPPDVTQNFYPVKEISADALMRVAVYRFGRNGQAFA